MAVYKETIKLKSHGTTPTFINITPQVKEAIANSNIQNGLNIAILVDTGHATPSGRYVSGTHYIDETIKEIYKYIDNKK